ncbi:MAG: DUF4962 domain-containing protein [Candidatus Pristimantibacillus sp.]
MERLSQPPSGVLTIAYAPDESTRFIENPPRFTWMEEKEKHGQGYNQYMLQYGRSPEFIEALTITISPVNYNFYTPDHSFEPGRYYWRYALVDNGVDELQSLNRRSAWSVTRSFFMPDQLPETPLPAGGTRYDKAKSSHPRLWLQPDGVRRFREQLASDKNYCGWDSFYEQSVVPWLSKSLIPEPKPYPNHQRTPKLWRRMYIDCQEVLYAVRHLSVAGIVLENEEMISTAKRWLLHAASWDTEGATSHSYNDEAAFRIAGALAWGYDWLYDSLSVEERVLVRCSLTRRTEQVAFHVIERSKIHLVPYDSHAVRSLSSVLVPCCIALLHEESRAREWLNYTLDYYGCLYTPWGWENGGWAEGVMYWTTGMAFLTEAFNMVKNYLDIDYYKRPFFQATGRFPLYCFSANTTRTSFGDQSNLGSLPGLKTAYLMRQFAGVTGEGLYQWYYETVKRQDQGTEMKGYNYGWWDFRFDELLYRHDYPMIEPAQPSGLPAVEWFCDVGWVALHHRMDDPDNHIMLLAKSSRYGSISHSHGDQNAFLLHAYGEPLAIASGHYVAFGSSMHLNWRRQTVSTNSLLIDGQGQYAGMDRELNLQAKGVVEEASYAEGRGYIRMDATDAYRLNVPELTQFIREIHFINHSYFVIVDTIDLNHNASIQWLLHSLQPYHLSDQSFVTQGNKAELLGQFVYASSGPLRISQHDQFTGVEPSELEGLPNQWHIIGKTNSAASHRIATLLVPRKMGSDSIVSYQLDEQEECVTLTFTMDGASEQIAIAKPILG